MKAPLISVLTVTYNFSNYISQTINSVLNQTYKNFELIICDDNSKDRTWELILDFSDPRIRAVKNGTNVGEYANRNQAISLAKGEYIIFIDGEDVLYKHGLETLVHYALNFPECAMLIGQPWDERIIYPKRITPYEFLCFQYLDKGVIGMNFTSIFFRTDVLKAVRGFDEPGIKMGDVYIQYKIGSRYDCLLIPDGFSWWRRRKNQASQGLIASQERFFDDLFSFALPILTDNHFLSIPQKRQGFANIYYNYIRFLVKEILRLRVQSCLFLLRKYPIPLSYWLSIFQKPKRNFFNGFSGEEPLQEKKCC